MIATVVRIGLLRLRNNPLELMLMFVVPIIFFSIFAMIFGGGVGTGKMKAVPVVFVDEDGSQLTQSLIEALASEDGLKVVGENGGTDPIRREAAVQQVRSGNATLAILFPRNFAAALVTGSTSQVEILADTSDQIATQVVSALVRQAIMKKIAAPASWPRAPNEAPMTAAGILDSSRASSANSYATTATNDTDPVIVKDVLSVEKANPQLSMYAAGIAVMFLLFSTSGAGGTLLEEQEAGTLERLLSSQLSVSQLLAGKWLLMVACGVLQVTVMFIWAQFVFDVDLVGHLAGFSVMTLATAAAAASLALLLATVCQTRAQLNGISVVLILTMSALGGSMVPRYIMSEDLQRYGLVTFNAWALDGYNKVFWRDLPVSELGPQLGVLLVAALVMAITARLFAQRWDA